MTAQSQTSRRWRIVQILPSHQRVRRSSDQRQERLGQMRGQFGQKAKLQTLRTCRHCCFAQKPLGCCCLRRNPQIHLLQVAQSLRSHHWKLRTFHHSKMPQTHQMGMLMLRVLQTHWLRWVLPCSVFGHLATASTKRAGFASSPHTRANGIAQWSNS